MLRPLPIWLLLVALGCSGGEGPRQEPKGSATSLPSSAPSPAWKVLQRVQNGRVENHGGLRVVHLWGTPEQRGRAHAELLGDEIAKLMRREFDYRFGRAPQLLALVRGMLPRLVRYPDAMRAELAAMFETMKASGADLSMPTFKRDMDL